ncbi:MAG: FAD-dependent 5-carboxymethylaminomethyl-2-thiouridine(34) oxidoreductase MnmC, partial [Hyphomonadaceae bacterium]
PPPQALYPHAGARPTTAAVIGAGIAGAAMAHALAQRGCAVAVYEAGPAPAAGASGNPAGLVMPRLDRGQGPVQALYLGAFVHAVAAYGAALDRCGVIERDRPDLIADPPLPEDWLTPENESDIVHRHAGLVRPAPLIEAWLQGADLRCSQSVARLAHENGHWRLFNADGARLGQADAVVLANGAALNRFAQTAWLDLRLTAGQIECGACADPPARVLLGESYAAPFQGGLLFGATFDRVAVAEARPAPDARARNLAALEALAPALAARLDRRTLSSRAGVRAAAPDYAPIAGLAPDAPVWLARQAGLAHGRPPDLSAPAPAHANLYVLGGLGARGLTLAPILAERIAAEMFGEPQILLRDALAAAHPARFLHRTLKRGLTKPNLGETSDDDLD